ncbi:MAG TPA: ATP-binding protein [Chloroflexi bacterium]|nr:ATP-binding protein [Chloroflexota bacterium]
MIPRLLAPKIQSLVGKFPVIALTGPRQSGKTTLVKAVFPELPYVSLEEPDIRQFALTDPRGFLSNYPHGAILDEVQRAPDLFSYIQAIVDNDREALFVLTGSANFLLMEQISQTLAGRSAVLHLLPFSMPELRQGGFVFAQYEQLLFTGQYPRIYDRDIAPTDFYPAYIQTYVERDVRQIQNITDLNTFILFVQLCAGRTGQLLNYTSLANDTGVSPNTARAWLSILEASYIVYRLYPYHKNFRKRLVKSPKLYFYDTGLACSLLGIRSAEQVNVHFLKGALFENLIINEFIKRDLNQGARQRLWFWRDSQGKEIDCLLPNGDKLIPVEIKAGKTISGSYFSNINYWQQLTGQKNPGYVVYGGDASLQTSNGNLVSWQELEKIAF